MPNAVWIVPLVIIGVGIVVGSIVMMVLHERAHRGHNDADYHCKFWWGDRQESINAQCLICNPRGEDILHGSKDRL